jgi:hypothetical protein
MQSGTERRVHFEVTWSSVCCAFNLRYATEFVIVTHQLFVLNQPGTIRKASPLKSSCGALKLSRYAAHIFASGCFRGTRAARCCSKYIEDHDVADA